MPFDATNFNDGYTETDHWHLRLLDELERVLDNVPEGQLNQDHWWQKDHCGTTGCILGWACHDAFFQGLGLRFLKVCEAKNYTAGEVPIIAYKDEDTPRPKKAWAWHALFGERGHRAHHLFVPWQTRERGTKEDVRERINKLREEIHEEVKEKHRAA